MAHFGASFVGCEYPIDAGAGGVSLLLPCGDFADEAFGVVDSAVEALAAQHADLDLDSVQDEPGLGGREGLIEGAGGVGRQVVLHARMHAASG